MKKITFTLIIFVLAALALGIINLSGGKKVEIVKTETQVVTKETPVNLDSLTNRISGVEKKIQILENGFPAIANSLKVILENIKNSSSNLGGLVHNVQEIFAQGLKAGTDQRQLVNSNGQLIGPIGGAEWATTTRSNATTTLDNICSYGQWTLTKGAAGAEYALRFPSTNTMAISSKENQCLSQVGDTHTIMVFNASSTSTGKATTTFSTFLNTGIEIMVVSTSTPSIESPTFKPAQILNGEAAILKFWRRSNATTSIIFQRVFGIGNP